MEKLERKVIDGQVRLVEALRRQIETLQNENRLLKQTIKRALYFMPIHIPDEVTIEVEDESEERWMDKYQRFESIRSQLLKIAVEQIKTMGNAVHQDLIIDAYMTKYPKIVEKMKSPGETLGRRLRELRDLSLLTSPRDGHYFIGPKLKNSEV